MTLLPRIATYQSVLILLMCYGSTYGWTNSPAPPCTPAMEAFNEISPMNPVLTTGSLANFFAGMALGAEYGPPATIGLGWKLPVVMAALGFSYVQIVAGVHPCMRKIEGEKQLDPKVAHEEWEREVRNTYLFGGINLGLGAAMVVLSEHPVNRTIASIGVVSQLLAVFLVRDRFQFKLPTASEKVTAEFSPVCKLSAEAVQSCLSLRF